MDSRETRQKLIPILLLVFTTVMATASIAIADDTGVDNASSAAAQSTKPQSPSVPGGGIGIRKAVAPRPVVTPKGPVAPPQVAQPRDAVQPRQ